MTTKKQDNQINVVGQASLAIGSNDAWRDTTRYLDLGLAIGFMQYMEMEEFSDRSLKYAYEAYSVLLEAMDVDDIENSYESWGALVETSAKKQSEGSN